VQIRIVYALLAGDSFVGEGLAVSGKGVDVGFYIDAIVFPSTSFFSRKVQIAFRSVTRGNGIGYLPTQSKEAKVDFSRFHSSRFRAYHSCSAHCSRWVAHNPDGSYSRQPESHSVL
jgi:hypothetical protein